MKATTLAGLGLAFASFDLKKYSPLLSFSTLGCPDWTFDTILNFASDHGYSGIELRGILRQLDLTKCPEFDSPKSIAATRKRVEDKKLRIVDLGASANLHFKDPAVRKKNLDEAKNFIRLAQQLGCPHIRVFPNNLPKDQEKNETLELIAGGLRELGDVAKGSGVTVLMETHGDVVYTADIEKIMQSVNHPQVGLVWDIVNMWSVTKEPVAGVYDRLKKYIRFTHIKDMKVVEGKNLYVKLGQGETPIFEAIDVLAKNEYPGYFSFEWEKLWHPEIEDPEIVLADYPLAMKNHFKA